MDHFPQLSEVPRRPGATASVARKLWRAFLLFLDLIGLRQERRIEQETQLGRFRLYHAEFRKLLSANNSFLENMADLERKLDGEEAFDRTFVKRKVVRTVADVHAMIESLGTIADGRYEDLRKVFERLTRTLTEAVEDVRAPAAEGLALDLSLLNANLTEVAGGKMANLGEVRNVLGLPTPDSFVVTTDGYRLLLEEGGIASLIQAEQMDLATSEDAREVSDLLRERILRVRVPTRLSEAILAAHDRLAAGLPSGRTRLAVRSSAIGEDGDRSFAGQFLSLLNVPREELVDAYVRVIASLFSPEAVHYRLLHGITGESAGMAVGFVVMVEAEASGILYSRDPNRPGSGEILIHAVRGLGVTLADGHTSPEIILVSRDVHSPRVVRMGSRQASRQVCAEDAGVREEPVAVEELGRPCISDDEAMQLARWALVLEAHFGSAQDIEWALDGTRRFVVLQSRPLRLTDNDALARRAEPVPGVRVLVAGGEMACPGVGTGRAVRMDEDSEFDSFPHGGVLVAQRSSPKFVRLMAKAKAIVTDAGSTTGHMASLVREFHVPALLNTRTATGEIPEGMVITVDATNGFVYEGEVPDLAGTGQEVRFGPPVRRGARATPEMRLLEKVAEFIVPLNLADPRSPGFSAGGARTLHDLARFIHEKSYQEMFRMGEKLGDFRSASYQLDVFLPIDLYIVDLGGGLKPPARGRSVRLEHLTSTPLLALLKGMLNEKIPRFGPRPMDLGGFFGVMMRHALTSPEQERTFRDPSYALVSDRYVNYTARVGYHFGVVDSYCGQTTNKNYISLHFRGGAADRVRRGRRVRAIGGILKEHGFSVVVSEDHVHARISKASREETETHLEMIGKLLQFFRQMDVAMVSEGSVERVQKAFLAGDYALEGLASGSSPIASEGEIRNV